MGGKIFKIKECGFETIRLTTSEFEPLMKKLISITAQYLNTDCETTKYYKKKETHGDGDILINKKPHITTEFVFLSIRKMFGEDTSISENSKKFTDRSTNTTFTNVISFAYKMNDGRYFQIDYILVPEEIWGQGVFDYFSYDPLPNLVSKPCRQLFEGFMYGHDGLKYSYLNDNYKEYIMVSRDTKKIFEFLDFDYNQFKNGFETLTDIFEFIIKSKYFHPNFYKLENLRHTDRKRNKKRKSFQDFVSWLRKNGYLINETNRFTIFYSSIYVWIMSKIRKIEKVDMKWKSQKEIIKFVNDFFPESNLINKIEKLDNEFILREERHEKFNGDIITSLIGIEKKTLGRFIENFKKNKSINTSFNNYIDTSNSEQIRIDIIEHYKKISIDIN